MNKTISWVKTIYLYLFSLLGLVLIIIGTVNFLEMGLKAYVFTQADQTERVMEQRPVMPHSLEKEDVENIKESGSLSSKQEEEIENWLSSYKEWQEQKEKTDPLTSRRHGEAANNLALIIVGIPVFLYHWRIVRREQE